MDKRKRGITRPTPDSSTAYRLLFPTLDSPNSLTPCRNLFAVRVHERVETNLLSSIRGEAKILDKTREENRWNLRRWCQIVYDATEMESFNNVK
ncbi:hypothetical protein H6P81_006322 [Aristolochia fimbriata]|uniref:Uncharacterized protein n=1 Tax=Aristolochia fimbriata TaxID=158543 RepID=A0AAV7EXG0_ARIFI|nr:hypothetical protein H6P81_006322 [Aristolochia fimbriata]